MMFKGSLTQGTEGKNMVASLLGKYLNQLCVGSWLYFSLSVESLSNFTMVSLSLSGAPLSHREHEPQ